MAIAVVSQLCSPLLKLIQKDSTQVQGWDCTEAQSPWRSLQRICLSVGLCKRQKAARGITGLLPPDNGTFCSWCIPKFWRKRKTKQKPAIRLKQSPWVLINIHLHENSPLWLNSGSWVRRPMWCYGPSEGGPRCTAQRCMPRAKNLPCLAGSRLFGLRCSS